MLPSRTATAKQPRLRFSYSSTELMKLIYRRGKSVKCSDGALCVRVTGNKTRSQRLPA